MPPALPILLHSTALAAMYSALKSISALTDNPVMDNQTGGKWQFLTIQGLALSIATMATCLISDLTSSGFTGLRRHLLMITLPLSATISTIYWGLLLAMPELILPPPAEPGNPEPAAEYGSQNEVPDLFRLPVKLDLVLHLLPFASQAVHFVLFETKYKPRDARVVAPLLAAAFGLYYSSFAEYCAKHNGFFSYPFLNVPFQIRVPIYAGAVGIAFGSFTLLNALHRGNPLLHSPYSTS